MLSFAILFVCFSLASPAPDLRVVHRVVVEGNRTVPSLTILGRIKTTPGSVVEETTLREDILLLHRMGCFRSIEADIKETGDGRANVIFRVEERPRIMEFTIAGVTPSMEARIERLLVEEKLDVNRAGYFDPSGGKRAALAVRRFLRACKHPFAEAEMEIGRDRAGVALCLRIRAGPNLAIGAVRFRGNNSIPEAQLLKQMHRTRPSGVWDIRSGRGLFSPEILGEDLRRVQEYYRSRGYAAAALGEPVMWVDRKTPGRWDLWGRIRGEKQSISIEIPVIEGPKFRLRSVVVEGDAKRATEGVSALIEDLPVPSEYDLFQLERIKEEMGRSLGNHGYGCARVLLEQSTDLEDRSVDAVYRIDAGYPVIVRRIRFSGNACIPEKFLRREMTIQEGELFNASKLDESVGRLNRSGLIEEMARSDVLLKPGREPGCLDIVLEIKERPRQGLFFAGGDKDVGGPYLGIIYSAFNLLGLGDRLSVELDGGTGQSNFLLDLVGRRFLGTPFTLALSGFYRLTHISIAGIVPDLDDVVGLFSPNSKGAGLTGSYAVGSHTDTGIGFNLRRTGLSSSGFADQGGAALTSAELAPFVAHDSTLGNGPRRRGRSLWLRHAWIGEAFPANPRAVSGSFQFSNFVDDPWTAGRNSLAFRVRGAFIRSNAGADLPLTERLFPGDETVRGFGEGGLTPWASGSTMMNPAGADSVLGFSAEYRIPLRGRLSSVAFMDIGWSRLGSGRTTELGQGVDLVAATNNVLRASLGGELHLQLPLIRQPGRLVFAWNPMRLDRLVRNETGLLRLADPKSSIRFALGNVF